LGRPFFTEKYCFRAKRVFCMAHLLKMGSRFRGNDGKKIKKNDGKKIKRNDGMEKITTGERSD